jgi:hypothetical protein
MGTTPNFLWLEAILRHARAYLAARPDSPISARYLDSVIAAQDIFRQTRLGTDRAYSKWRHKYFDTIAAHKKIRVIYDQARRDCIEWGLDGFPDHFVSYTEEEATQLAAEDMIAFLGDVEIDTDWHQKAIVDLQQAVTDARAIVEAQEAEYRTYRGRVRERKLGYDRAYNLAREFFAAVEDDLDRDGEDYRKLSPYPLF